MEVRVIRKLNGTILPAVKGQAATAYELNFDVDDPNSKGVVTTNALDLEPVGSKIVNDWIASGDIFQGIPYTETVEDDNGSDMVFDGYADPSTPGASFECDNVKISTRVRGGNDWFGDKADVVYFNILESQGFITDADKIQIPYVVSSIPDLKAVAIASLTAFVVTQEIKRTISDLKNLTLELGNFMTALAAILKIIFYIAYVTILFISLLKLILEIKNALIQPIKYHVGMKYETLLIAGCKFLDLKFESSIFKDDFYKDTIILPKKTEPFDNSAEAGILSAIRGNMTPNVDERGYFEGSFGELLRISKDIFNAKIILKDGKLILERVDKKITNSNYVLDPVEQRISGTNAFEIESNYAIAFRTDLSEENTIDRYKGTTVRAITALKTVKSKDMDLMRGSKRVDIPFALGKEKQSLTKVEQRLSDFFTNNCRLASGIVGGLNGVIRARNKIVKVIGKILKALKVIGIKIKFNSAPIPQLPPFDCGFIETRLGMLLLSNDYFQVDKIMSLDIAGNPKETNLKSDNSARWSGIELLNKFHRLNLFPPNSEFPTGNQYRRYDSGDIKFCKEDFDLIKNNRTIFTNDGRKAIIETATWNPEVNTGRIKYRVPELLTNKLKVTIFEPDGSS